jgi:ATP-binding cassette subfamily B multidrug efflux pump
VMGMGFTVNLLQRGKASLARINCILEQAPDITDPDHPVAAEIKGAIAFKQLNYSYPGQEQGALRDVNLEIPRGQIFGILGRVGSGKSTLVHLLPRLNDPPAGTVFIDGVDVRDFSLSKLRSAISLVTQDIYLFSTSVRKNIGLGLTDPSAPFIEEMASLSTIDRDLVHFREGLDTVIGERGVSLSGGQKQRVAISRAAATDAQIVILDDAFSSVDTETEEVILQGLLRHYAAKTMIFISNRISTLKHADQIAVMDDGRVVQLGSHQQLIGEPGLYRDIYLKQQLEETIEASK